MTELQRKQLQSKENLKKAMEAKKRALMARREAYRRTQMDEFRDGMVSLVTDPETKKRPEKPEEDVVLPPVLPDKQAPQKGFKRPNNRLTAFKMAKRRKGRAA